MNNTLLPTFALDQAQSRVLSCRAQHQSWASRLSQSEAEIDQLLSLLTDLPVDTYRSLSEFSQTYASALSRLKTNIHQLQTDVVCDGRGCASTPPPATCTDVHFTSPVSSNALISSALLSYDQIKSRCNTYLAELVGLNLI
ncbi:hypothetical protein J2I47_02640 [Fibrella sp. HMF5335]|uniref:Uncharacterized protein n=1 Tax=Fibrella rubiginis TaxID=2817060 RepID=A0A939JZV5_9BACT|nr:hypothetical protein [Fibrella rubiginis]MBO0935437.1 hypothetical protein [Fibrella rubiginis]